MKFQILSYSKMEFVSFQNIEIYSKVRMNALIILENDFAFARTYFNVFGCILLLISYEHVEFSSVRGPYKDFG